MATNDAGDRSLEEFITYAEGVLGVRLTGWQRAMLADLVDEFLATPAKGEPVSIDLGDLTDEVRHALGEAGYT